LGIFRFVGDPGFQGASSSSYSQIANYALHIISGFVGGSKKKAVVAGNIKLKVPPLPAIARSGRDDRVSGQLESL
jgi:hypothetical protein